MVLLTNSAVVQAANVLLYHHVDDSTPKSTSVSVETFIQHLELIESLELKVVPLTAITDKLKAGESIPDHWLAITFDDGYRNVYENAMPLLKERNWPFTVFVNPKMVKPSKLYMDWGQIKDLINHGGLIANHTLSHENLVQDGLSLADIKANIESTEALIAEQVGYSLKILAYPYGEYNQAVKSMLKDMGYVGFAQHSGAINESSDLLALTRFPANGIYANPKTLKNKLASLPFSFEMTAPLDTHPVTLQPKWLVKLKERDFYQSQLACFISGFSKPVKPIWIDDLTFEVQAPDNIGTGRIKYNCTAPSKSKRGQFYWTSKLWINPKA